jgi:mono/diheme cytochrome c family protein
VRYIYKEKTMKKIHAKFGVHTVAAIAMLTAAVAINPIAHAEEVYKVEGTKVDKATFNGWKLYKRQRCETCHGPTAEGGAAFPNLLNSLKTMNKEDFSKVVLNGRGSMPPFQANTAVAQGIDGLYAYLKGRSDGAIPASELQEMP